MLLKRILIGLLLLLAPSVYAQGLAVNGSVINQSGTPIANAQIKVCALPGQGTPCANSVVVYGDIALTVPIQNPVTSDALGNYLYWVPAGNYQEDISGAFVQLHSRFLTIGNSSNIADPSSINNITYLDGVIFPQTDAGLISALSFAGDNGTLIIPPGANVVVTSRHTIATNYTTLHCEPGAKFTAGAASIDGFFLVEGVGDRVENCQFNPGAFGSTNFPLWLNGSLKTIVSGNTASGFINTGGVASFVYLSGTSQATISGNYCTTGLLGADCIFGERNSTDTLVEKNFLDQSLGASTAHAIAFHSTAGGQTVNGTRILNNQITGGANFCVEVGGFSGGVASNLLVSGNKCVLGVNGSGGYSIGSGATQFAMTNNSFDSNGFQVQIACLEAAQASDGVISNNTCKGGFLSMSNSQVQRIVVADNSFFAVPATAPAGIYFGTSITSGLVTDNDIHDNLIELVASANIPGIDLQCNASSSDCSRNSIHDNRIVGGAGVSQNGIGIQLENDTGTMANTQVHHNLLFSLLDGMNSIGSTGVGYSLISENVFASVGTVYAGVYTNQQISDLQNSTVGVQFSPAGNAISAPSTSTHAGNNLPILGSLTTTSGTSDVVTLTGMGTGSHCQLTATNASAATNLSTTYISMKAANLLTVTHTTTSGMTYDIACTPN